jgi:hypothetical protein
VRQERTDSFPPGGGINVTVRLAVTSSSTDGNSCRAGFTMKS